MEQKSLEEYIASLTPDEREKHQTLIQECLERKGLLRGYTEKTYDSIEQLSVNLKTINQGITDLQKYINIHQNLASQFLSDLIPLLKSLSDNKLSSN